MAIFKCKMCGAPLEVNDETTATCEYCGTAQTLPKLDDEKIANLYDRANHFRRNNEYDRAKGIFEQILDEDTKDAEAYWSIVLCKYGIEYVEEPITRKRVPTVNRTQFTSIYDDDNFKKALEYADVVQRKLYEEEAKVINEIQKGILTISQQEEPFDVFICYKETDNAGRRTPDSVLAQDLYNELTKEGFKVFFSRITLEDKLGTAYEPYIFAALNSAKVMVVVGTKPKYFNAVWVKNEWSRYLGLIKGGAKKTLVPAYKDMDPYDLPEEFSHLQAQDMNKLGFMQDLVRGIQKIVRNSETKEKSDTVQQVGEKTVVQITEHANVEPILKRMFMFLEDGDFEQAKNYSERVLDMDPENGYAYLGKMLAELKVKTKEELIKDNLAEQYESVSMSAKINLMTTTSLDKNANYQKIMRFGDDVLVAEMQEYNRIYTANRKNYHMRKKYDEVQRIISTAKTQKNMLDSIKLYEEAIEKLEAIQDYQDAKELAKQCRTQIEIMQKDKVYNQAEKIFSQNQYEEAIVQYEQIRDWKDAEEKIELCKKAIIRRNEMQERDRKIKEQQAEKERIEKERQEAIAKQKAAEKAEQNAKTFKILAPIVAVFAVIAIVMTTVVIPNGKYDDAVALMDDGKYEEAIVVFETLGNHKDSAEKLVECQYIVGKQYFSENKFGKALSLLYNASNYKDTRQLLRNINIHEIVSAANHHTIGLKSDGTVIAVGYNEYGQCNIEGWADIVSVSAGAFHTVGLKNDGTVTSVGDSSWGRRNVSEWTDIVSVSAGYDHTVGLKDDGTIVAVGYNEYGQCNIEGWADIVSVSAGGAYTVGLKSDGTVVAVGKNRYSQCEVSDWIDIVSVSAGDGHTVGLKNDGTVVAVGSNSTGECDVEGWTDIVLISAGDSHTVGLKSDGTVVAVGSNNNGQCKVENWTDIVSLSAGYGYTVGLKSDGTVVAVGSNSYGKRDVEDWKLFE